VDSNEGKAITFQMKEGNNYLGKVPMGFHGTIFTIGLCSLNEIRVYRSNPKSYDYPGI
jgi:hypothetical protein